MPVCMQCLSLWACIMAIIRKQTYYWPYDLHQAGKPASPLHLQLSKQERKITAPISLLSPLSYRWIVSLRLSFRPLTVLPSLFFSLCALFFFITVPLHAFSHCKTCFVFVLFCFVFLQLHVNANLADFITHTHPNQEEIDSVDVAGHGEHPHGTRFSLNPLK